MAIVFEMWAECSDERQTADLVKHFDGLEMNLVTGRTVRWEASADRDCPTGMRMWAPDLSRYGVRTVDDATESSETGIRLYHHLRTAPPFQFASVAWEAELVTLADLGDWIRPTGAGKSHLARHCVLAEAAYQKLGSPEAFVPFRPGYLWNRYYGESYRPLGSGDQSKLNEVFRQLFPNGWQ